MLQLPEPGGGEVEFRGKKNRLAHNIEGKTQ
jgi:hypothetical protein